MQQSFVLLKILLTLFVKECLSNSDVLTLSDEEYYQMPDLFALDHYPKCLSQTGAVFCVGTFELLSPEPSQLYEVMKKFSENSFSNFNHTKIHRGTCLGPRSACPLHKNSTWGSSFEACVNENMRKEYGFEARLLELSSCKTKDEQPRLDAYDWAFLYYALTLLGLNLAGTVYDLMLRDESERGNRLLLCFSLKENWKRFTSGATSDQRYQRLKCFNGLRAILMNMVNLAHVPIMLIIFTANPRFFEKLSLQPEFATLTTGTVAIQGFLVMSMFLRTFKTLIDSERYQLGAMTVVAATIERFVRIAPLFMTSVSFTATLARFLNDGPLWKKYVEDESQVCRDTFWRQLFLMQHWYAPVCVPQAWYLSVDFQLYVVCTSLTIFLIRRGKSILQPLLWLLAASLVVLFGINYALELKPCLESMRPETLYSLFKYDKSFILLYQSVWGNFPGALLGVLAAYLYYNARQSNIDLKQYKFFMFMFRMAFPITVLYCVMGFFFGGKITSRLSVSLIATLDKPVYAAVIAFFLLGCMYEVNHITRRAVEWRGWGLPARLSLASLLFHTTLAKHLATTKIFPQTFSRTNMVFDWFSITVGTFILALPLTILVEQPFIAVYKTFAEPRLLRGEKTPAKPVTNGTSTNGHAKNIKSN